MVEDLHLDRLVLEVDELVVDREHVRAGHGCVARLHADLRPEEARLLDMPLDDDLVRRLGVDVHGDIRRGDIRDPAVQAEGRMALRAVGMDRLDLERRPVVLQPAAGHQLVVAVEPAQAAGRHQVHEPRMDRAVGDRRLPAQVIPQVEALPQAHAPRRHDREPQRPVVHHDQVNPVATAAPQPALAHRPGGRHGQAQLSRIHRQVLDPHLVRDIRQHKCRHIECRFLDRSAARRLVRPIADRSRRRPSGLAARRPDGRSMRLILLPHTGRIQRLPIWRAYPSDSARLLHLLLSQCGSDRSSERPSDGPIQGVSGPVSAGGLDGRAGPTPIEFDIT